MTGRQTFDPQTGERSNGRKRLQRRTKLPDRYELLIDGQLTVEDLDDEELFRGQLRGVNGTFSGHPPRAIPWSMHKASMDAVTKRIERDLISSMPEILASLVAIATASASGSCGRGGIDAKAQVDAAKYLMDRILGKTPDRVEIDAQVTNRWEEAAAGGRLFVDIEAAPTSAESAEPEDVVDAELVPTQAPRLEIEAEPASTLSEPSFPAARPRPVRKKTGIKLS